MKVIALIGVLGMLLLQASDSVVLASVGGSMTIGFAYLAAALVVAVYEAVRMRRGVLGWIVNVVVAFVGCLVGANIGGVALALVLSLLFHVDRTIAATGGLVTSLALSGGMLVSIFCAWGAIQLVNRWR